MSKLHYPSDDLQKNIINLKEQRNLESEINAIKFQNKKQSIISPTDGFVAKMIWFQKSK